MTEPTGQRKSVVEVMRDTPTRAGGLPEIGAVVACPFGDQKVGAEITGYSGATEKEPEGWANAHLLELPTELERFRLGRSAIENLRESGPEGILKTLRDPELFTVRLQRSAFEPSVRPQWQADTGLGAEDEFVVLCAAALGGADWKETLQITAWAYKECGKSPFWRIETELEKIRKTGNIDFVDDAAAKNKAFHKACRQAIKEHRQEKGIFLL